MATFIAVDGVAIDSNESMVSIAGDLCGQVGNGLRVGGGIAEIGGPGHDECLNEGSGILRALVHNRCHGVDGCGCTGNDGGGVCHCWGGVGFLGCHIGGGVNLVVSLTAVGQ